MAFVVMGKMRSDFQQVINHADMAAQDRQAGIQRFDFRFGHMRVVKRLQTVKPEFQITDIVFAERIWETTGVLRGFDPVDEM